MESLIAQIGFKGSFDDFSTYCGRNELFLFHARVWLALTGIFQARDPELARLFGKLHVTLWGEGDPAYAEKSQTTAYYESDSTGRQAGLVHVNTYGEHPPKWEMEALSLHEAVPGHHLQIALAQEMQDARNFASTAAIQLLSRVGTLFREPRDGNGFYKDPYMKYGQLTYEMWRAIRLVVDTACTRWPGARRGH